MTSAYDTGRFADVPDQDLAAVRTHTDVARIVEQMLTDLRTHPHEWENPTLERFLEALAASLESLEPLHTTPNEAVPSQPTWKLLADVLVKASGYE
ncbi:hypothetical protein ODJ79_35215 [Actinoplanes sp. KI2]|uniref:DUF7660 family protein n=1 Tax=Actinoplanes sp. KI2 TaxID=2983315 RepID=UPI0021D574D4|nr:hypothetical protein [Actinoplanes sp. KI2]MCU7728992.1 hypothetical protein [Actinoplanes sp. KI2]